jgi:SPP1 family predicted phage head-tail adaptor
MSAAGPSRLRHRILIETPVEVADGAGGVRRTWQASAPVWAAVQPLKAADAPPLALPGQTVTHRVTLRWRAGLTTAARLRLGARVFALRAVHDPEERRRVLVCLAEEARP